MIIDKQIDIKIKARLAALGNDEDETRAKYMADQSGLPYINLKVIAPEMDSLLKVPLVVAQKYNLAPFKLRDGVLHIAISDPSNEGTINELLKIKEDFGKPIIYVASTTSLKHVYGRYSDLEDSSVKKKGVVDLNGEHLAELMMDVHTLADFQKSVEYVAENEKRERVSKLIELTMAGAIHFGASDIHIEPESELVRYRYRLDGQLLDVYHTDKKTYELMVSRIKLLSGLKLSNTQVAQDGRFSMERGAGGDIEMRVSLVPTGNGESFVMRLLDPKNANVPFESLGMNVRLMSELDKAIRKPFGMVLTTGPTGSGKSTTLYACLKKVYAPEVKIITIEDPIEYHLDGIVQTQVEVKKDYTFLAGLRAAMRQDPDVIMVGEIRDEDTAKVASQAALTGHIVLSTLHTNTAAGAVPRFVNLGVDAKTLGSALTLVMAQRLCRKLCTACKIESVLGDQDAKIFTNILGAMIADGKESKYEPSSVYKVYIANKLGCDKCTLGYKGRIGIYEAIIMNRKIEEVSISSGSERDIADAARDQGIPDMREDGVTKILDGITDIEELTKVVDLVSN